MGGEQEFAEGLIDFIHTSPSPFHVVTSIEGVLLDRGFQPLGLDERWKMSRGDKYFVTVNGSAIVAFVVGEADVAESGFRLIGSHTDSPSFRVKPSPEMVVEDAYLKLNTEVYGSPIFNTWLDRPLCMAGRVSLRSDDVLCPESRLVWFDEPILVIPNQSLHMNRKVNEGLELNPQDDLPPLMATVSKEFEKQGFLAGLLGERLGVNLERVIDFDLFLSEHERGSLVGLEQEFVSCTKLDNLAMVHASLHAFVASEVGTTTNLLVCYDNEEVGSRTKQGAASPLLSTLLERIVMAVGKDREDFHRAVHNSFFISADMGHAVHPNAANKHDPVHKPVVNGGPMVKIAAKKNFITDSNSAVVYKMICEQLGVPVQTFVSRSDQKGGSTIGPITTTQLAVRSLDVGNPTLAMHSIRELMGVLDHHRIGKSFEGFYGLERLPNI
jgi:aspartyl aminopeptidase